MKQQQCSSCGLRNSVYGQFCNECQKYGLLVSKDDTLRNNEGLPRPNKKKKKRILSTLDILLSVFIVTPLVVACWRGTWQLMDIYADYFPPWESFMIGTLIHVVIGISQESFNVLVNRQHQNLICSIFSFLFMKLYTIVLNGVTNMHWRGGWILVDDYFGIGHSKTGEVKIENKLGATCFFAGCFLIMFAMRCLRNLNSPPFEICLDYGDDMFLFPSMFRVKVSVNRYKGANSVATADFGLYKDMVNQKTSLSNLVYGFVGAAFLCILFLLTLFAAISSSLNIQHLMSSENCGLKAEHPSKTGAATWEQQEQPRPFDCEPNEHEPKGFTLHQAKEPFPHTNAYLHIIYPNKKAKNPENIQDVIDSLISESRISGSSNQHSKSLGADPYLEHLKGSTEHMTRYKPLHPSEVNLLAPVRFRLGPTTWKDHVFQDQPQFGNNIKDIQTPRRYFPAKNMFSVSEKVSLYILDIVFSVSVVANLGIIIWRGLWLIVDIYFFPEDEIFSAWGSLFLGYVMVAIVFFLQPVMKKICDNISGVPRLLVADAYMMFSVMGGIVVWRGIWILLNIYFLPDDEELSCWITMWIPMIILMLMGCSNSLLVRGVCLDCEEPDGTCIIFPCNYLKVIFDQEQFDTWFSIWNSVSKNKQKEARGSRKEDATESMNYHIVQVDNQMDADEQNNNVNKNGIS